MFKRMVSVKDENKIVCADHIKPFNRGKHINNFNHVCAVSQLESDRKLGSAALLFTFGS